MAELQHPLATEIGCFGKIPSENDFVRTGAQGSCSRKFDVWLREGTAHLLRNNISPQRSVTHFLFGHDVDNGYLLGSLTPSRDGVQRSFPLAVYCRPPAQDMPLSYPRIPQAFSAFINASASFVSFAQSLQFNDLTTELEQLSKVVPTGYSPVSSQQSFPIGADELMQRMFAEQPPHSHEAAFGLFTSACQRRNSQLPYADATLDCPVSSDIELYFWLELSQRLLNWSTAAPTFVWRTESSRLLICLGLPSAQTFEFMESPNAKSPHLWPLHGQEPQQIEACRQVLTARQRHALTTSGLSIPQLLDDIIP